MPKQTTLVKNLFILSTVLLYYSFQLFSSSVPLVNLKRFNNRLLKVGERNYYMGNTWSERQPDIPSEGRAGVSGCE